MVAGDLGVDVWVASEAATTKPFGYMRFDPGPGVGGHCLPVDPSYLSWKVRRTLGRSFRFVELANDVNEHMPAYVVQRLVLALNRQGRTVSGARVLLLGLTYKRNTGDARESPGLVIAKQLAEMGAMVHVCDPHLAVRDCSFPLVAETPAEVSEADAVVVVTDHDTFDYDSLKRHARYVLDTRNRIQGANVERL